MPTAADWADHIRLLLAGHIAMMAPTEVNVMLFVAERLTMGRSQYGVLNPADPARDWDTEMLEEMADLLVYRSAKKQLESA